MRGIIHIASPVRSAGISLLSSLWGGGRYLRISPAVSIELLMRPMTNFFRLHRDAVIRCLTVPTIFRAEYVTMPVRIHIHAQHFRIKLQASS